MRKRHLVHFSQVPLQRSRHSFLLPKWDTRFTVTRTKARMFKCWGALASGASVAILLLMPDSYRGFRLSLAEAGWMRLWECVAKRLCRRNFSSWADLMWAEAGRSSRTSYLEALATTSTRRLP